MNTVLLDVLRLVGCLQAFIVVAMTTWIVIRYAAALKDATNRPRRILVYHIICIGVSYITLTVMAVLEMMVRYGSPYTWRAPVALFAFSLGDLALFLMLFRITLMRRLYDEANR